MKRLNCSPSHPGALCPLRIQSIEFNTLGICEEDNETSVENDELRTMSSWMCQRGGRDHHNPAQLSTNDLCLPIVKRRRTLR